jgi:Gpi18-like mannosyltransferase
VVYTAFVLLCVANAGRRAWALSAVFFGVALSFKLQAVFISPLLLYLVLSRQMKVRHLALAPLTYLAMMTPAWLAGRPWGGMLKTYFYQAQTFEKLAVSAPNPWFFVDYLFVPPPPPVYIAGVVVGLALASIAGLLISLGALRLAPGPRTNLLVATLCAGLMPYLLPKMHDRYFFVADVLAIAFAFAFRRYWVAAVLFQVGSLVTYLRYFGFWREAPAFGFLPITLGVCTLMLAFVGMQRSTPGFTAARSGRRAWGKVLPSSPGS